MQWTYGKITQKVANKKKRNKIEIKKRKRKLKKPQQKIECVLRERKQEGVPIKKIVIKAHLQNKGERKRIKRENKK